MAFDPEHVSPPGARIKVIGVGGGGGNAVNTMIRGGLEGVDFVTCNTDIQALRFSLAGQKIQIGKDLTRGLGAGADPDVGRDAALEDRHEIQQFLEGADMVFITAGMGGGTGTGGASVVAQIARELGALTVAVVTKPFGFEGKRRRKHADAGIARLRECVDTLITIPNQRLLQVASPGLSMIDAFKMADDVLVNAVKGISDIINIPGVVNVDFADVKTVMSCMGQALMGIGRASGENRAVEAARQAISSPLLEDIDIEGATGILVNITASPNMTLMEVNEACSIIQEAAHEDANFIFGSVIDESLEDEIRVTVIATGFPVEAHEDTGDVAAKPQQPSVLQQFNTRLTSSPVLGASKSPQRAVPQHQYAPLTKRPEVTRPAVRPEAPASEPVHAKPAPQPAAPTVAAPVAPTPSEPVVFAPQIEVPVLAPQPVAAPVAQAPVNDYRSVFEEAQELTRLTLGNMDEPEYGSSEAASESSQDFDLYLGSAPEAPIESLAVEPVRTGASHFDAQGEQADDHSEQAGFSSLFAEESNEAELGQGQFAADRSLFGATAQGETEAAAPLENLFDSDNLLITSDIDRKIDEALQLAERMKAPKAAGSADDLDVPAFLRNGLKDLPIG